MDTSRDVAPVYATRDAFIAGYVAAATDHAARLWDSHRNQAGVLSGPVVLETDRGEELAVTAWFAQPHGGPGEDDGRRTTTRMVACTFDANTLSSVDLSSVNVSQVVFRRIVDALTAMGTWDVDMSSPARFHNETPDGSDQWYRDFADAYLAAASSGSPVAVIAEASQIPARRVSRWAQVARQRGMLPPDKRGVSKR